MMGLQLIEEHLFPGSRVRRDCRAELLRPKSVSPGPLHIYSGISTEFSHLSPVRSPEEISPTDINAIAEVSHIDQSLLAELTTQERIHSAVDLPAGDHRGLSSLVRGGQAAEPDLECPARHMGALVLKQYRGITRIWRRPIYLRAHLLGPQ